MEESYYNSIAKSYNELHGEEQKKKFNLIKIELSKYYSDKEINKLKILDIGAGTGIASFETATLLEPSRELLKLAKQKNKFVGSAEKLPFKDQSFNLIISLSALHLTDIKKAIEEIKRVIKKDETKKKLKIDVDKDQHSNTKIIASGKEKKTKIKERPTIVLSIFKRAKNFEVIKNEIKKSFKILEEIDEGVDWIWFCE